MFRESFKYYKSNNPPPSMDNVIDVTGVDKQYLKRISSTCLSGRQFPGLLPPKSWEVYEVISRPGLILIANPFTPQGQRYWITRCLKIYPKSPNCTNLLPGHLESFNQIRLEGWWDMLQSISDPNERRKFSKTLRWVTLGYHYQWTSKLYDDKLRSDFPEDLDRMVGFFADILGYGDYTPQAAIINYYPVGSTLSGHTDHSEHNLNAPIFSYSFGQEAIFLLGGTTLDEKPDAILLRSGDVLVMTEQSRQCYHAVPRVFTCNQMAVPRWDPHTEEPHTSTASHGDWCCCDQCWSVWRRNYEEYIGRNRININIRQVLNKGQHHLM